MAIIALSTAVFTVVQEAKAIMPANTAAIITHFTVSAPFSSAKNAFILFTKFFMTFPQYKINNFFDTNRHFIIKVVFPLDEIKGRRPVFILQTD
ncbi:MAG: hypothetical protein PHD43_19790 [Methylococcales bacterium]|nr:hypothetical protein [Methylococcales bacterium]